MNAEDVVMLPQDQPPIQGRDAVRRWQAQSFRSIKAFHVTISHIEGGGNLAWTWGAFDMTVEPAAGQQVDMKGKWSCTWRKGPDARWLVASDAWSVDQPVAAGSDAGAADAVRSAIAALRDAVNSGDGAAVYRITADDFELMAPGHRALSGANARDFLAGMVTQFDARLAPFTGEEIIVSGDWAVQRYTYELTLTPKAGGTAATERGDGIHLFHRDASDAWRLSKDVFTSVAESPARA